MISRMAAYLCLRYASSTCTPAASLQNLGTEYGCNASDASDVIERVDHTDSAARP